MSFMMDIIFDKCNFRLFPEIDNTLVFKQLLVNCYNKMEIFGRFSSLYQSVLSRISPPSSMHFEAKKKVVQSKPSVAMTN